MLVLSRYVENRHTATLIGQSPARVGYLLKDRVTQVQDFLDALTCVGALRLTCWPGRALR